MYQQLLLQNAPVNSKLLTVCEEISNRAGGCARANKKFQLEIGN